MEVTETVKIMEAPKNVVTRPRCPHCGKLVVEWLKGEMGYYCDRCKTSSIINSSAPVGLTKFESSAKTILTK